MFVIGIAGGSGSGKTTVVKNITDNLKEQVVVIPQDSYYKDSSHLALEERQKLNRVQTSFFPFQTVCCRSGVRRSSAYRLRKRALTSGPAYSIMDLPEIFCTPDVIFSEKRKNRYRRSQDKTLQKIMEEEYADRQEEAF